MDDKRENPKSFESNPRESATSLNSKKELNLKKRELNYLIGNSTFIEARNLANDLGIERLFLKFEGSNPTGTQKDRIAFAIVEKAKEKGYNGVLAATCGNFGAALAYTANYFDLPSYIYIPKNYHVPKTRLELMKKYNAEIIYVDGHYEDVVEYSTEISKEDGVLNANPGQSVVKEISLNAYGDISLEIFRSLRKSPDYVFCPVGNGTTLAGIYKGFKVLLEKGKIGKVPKIIATSTRQGNPIVKSYKEKRKKILELSPSDIRESAINEPLTNWRSYDGQEALDAIYESTGFADYASDSKMLKMARLVSRNQGLNILPASASTISVMTGLKKENVVLKGLFVAILTGRDYH